MNSVADISLPAAIFVSFLLVCGAGLALTGAIGLTRFGNFYQRVHAPTLGTSYGTFLILAASIVYFSAARGTPVLHELLIGVFLTATTPVSLMLVVRAGLHRDQAEGKAGVPQPEELETRDPRSEQGLTDEGAA